MVVQMLSSLPHLLPVLPQVVHDWLCPALEWGPLATRPVCREWISALEVMVPSAREVAPLQQARRGGVGGGREAATASRLGAAQRSNMHKNNSISQQYAQEPSISQRPQHSTA